jgi:molybdopterin molybdotransferase
VPAFDRAAMDGYAVIASDTAGVTEQAPRTLVCVENLSTGRVTRLRVASGQCMQIPTGAPMPAGADAVVMVEQTRREDDGVRILARAAPGQHIGRRASDVMSGTPVLRAGEVLTPGRVGALAAIGATEAEVFGRPSVAIVSTGGEVVGPGQPLAPGEVYDINRFTLSAIVARHGGSSVPGGAAPADRVEELAASLDGARTHDIIVFSGGSSVGPRDLMADAVAAAGGDVLFHGIAVKPGKPTLFGQLGNSLLFGMPGNPTSCLSNAYILLVPVLRRVARLPAWRPRTADVPLARRVASTPGRHQFYTVRLENGRAEPAFKSSGDITSMAHADGYIEIAADSNGLDAGTLVSVTLFD